MIADAKATGQTRENSTKVAQLMTVVELYERAQAQKCVLFDHHTHSIGHQLTRDSAARQAELEAKAGKQAEGSTPAAPAPPTPAEAAPREFSGLLHLDVNLC